MRTPRLIAALSISVLWLGAMQEGLAQLSFGLYKDGKLVDSFGGAQSAPTPTDPAKATANAVTRPSLASAFTAASPPISTETQTRNQVFGESARIGLAIHELLGQMEQAQRTSSAAEKQRLRTAPPDPSTHQEQLRSLLQQYLSNQEEARTVLDATGKRVVELGLPQEIFQRHMETVATFENGVAVMTNMLGEVLLSKPNAVESALALVDQFKFRNEPDLTKAGPTRQAQQIRPAPEMTREQADELLRAQGAADEAGTTASGTSGKGSSVKRAAQSSPTLLKTARSSGGANTDPHLLSSPPTPADVAATIDVQLTAEITNTAVALGNSPLAIYEFVRNNCAFQPYLGSRKGSVFTLRQRAGNDTDQASLLLALLRASGIPCRYVRGSVEMTPEQAMSWLGVEDARTAGSILTTAGLGGLNIVDGGGSVTAIRCTRVWVEAYLPYSNYRGVPNDDTGKTWIPLDPALKAYNSHAGENVLAAMAFNTDAFLSDYISTFHAQSPLEKLQSDIQTWLNVHRPGKTVADIERTLTLSSLNLGLLPASLPQQILSVSSRFSQIESNKRYHIRFHLYNGGTTFIDYTISLPELITKKLTIDYVGATAADQATIDAHGGIYQTPPNLVNVKPRLKLDYTPVVTSANFSGMGYTHSWDMHFIQPLGDGNVQPTVANDITTGNGQAVAFDTFLDVPLGAFLGSEPSGSLLESTLHDTAAQYLSRVDRGIEKACALMRMVTTQDISEAIVENSVKVTYSFGTPITFEWTGLIVDADRRIIGSFAIDGDTTKPVPFMKLTGYDGSNMENRVFEDMHNQEAVSTIKILQLANDRGVGVCTITSSIGGQCPGISQPSSVINAINSALAQGHHVVVPRGPITVGEWSGTGYIDLDPASGAAGYIISGGMSGNLTVSGGATVQIWIVFLPCWSPTIAKDLADPIKSYVVGETSPTDVFSGGDSRHIRIKGHYIVKCPSKPDARKFFDQTMWLPIKWIDSLFGPGEYTFSIASTVLHTFTIFDIKLDSVDANFAPSAEQLEVKYSVRPDGFSAPYAQAEVFMASDTANPLFKDTSIATSGTKVVYNWNGKANQGAESGKYVSPLTSPFVVRVSADTTASFMYASKDEKQTKVEVDSIEMWPGADVNIVKPSTTAVEIDKQMQATIKIKKKDFSGAITEIPLKLCWTYEDPDDTASSLFIDGNWFLGNDNAPIANGGKRGVGKMMWAASTGFPAALDPNGQEATSETSTAGADKGKTKIRFLTSAIAGDNYVLVAKLTNAAGSVIKEKKAGVWAVRKRVTFPRVYTMVGGGNAVTVMSKPNIDPAFSGDGYTDYSLGSAVSLNAANSPEYVVPLLAPTSAETPTATELADYSGTDPTKKIAAKSAIEAKAQAWYQRNENNRGTALVSYVSSIGASGRCIIGARYTGEKLDGRSSTGQTAYYPVGITVTTPAGAVDPDGDWFEPQGTTVGGTVVFLYLNAGGPGRLQVAGRHEAGHASDHVPFGPGDHAAAGLMHRTADMSSSNPDGVATFSDESILRLRGWTP